MTDITTENASFIKIVDATYDSKVLNGLVSAGVLPATFRVIKATATLSATAIDAIVPFLDVNTGDQVQLGEQTAILYAAAYGPNVVGVGSTYNIGLATRSVIDPVPPTATTTFLFSAATSLATTLPLANVVSGISTYVTGSAEFAPVSRGVTLSTASTGTFLQVQVKGAIATSGTITVVLVVV
jgi:hypothetical protein